MNASERVFTIALLLVAGAAAAFTIAQKYPVGEELRVEALSYNADADALTFRFRWTWRDQGQWHTKREQVVPGVPVPTSEVPPGSRVPLEQETPEGAYWVAADAYAPAKAGHWQLTCEVTDGEATASRTRTWEAVWTAPLLVIEQEGGGGLVAHIAGWEPITE